jgi:hypothetical protein
MPSRLSGLTKTLAWTDFGNPVPKTAPAAGATSIAAHTETIAPLNYGWASSGKKVSLQDNVTVSIQFVASKSWVADWAMQKSQQFQDDLLNHEQGHYDITALMARDLFIEIMQLKGQTFANKNELDKAIADLVTEYAFQPVHNKYDEKSETNHGMNAPQQATWDALFQKARTMLRTPAESAPDGTPYKVRLLDALRQVGKAP